MTKIDQTSTDPVLLPLSGGLRLLHHHAPSSRVAIFGIAFAAGSSNDPEGAHGLAHFVEHTIFKGTTSRSAWDIINCMEAVGGELNAFTTKEETNVYTIFPTGYEERAAELIADLCINATFPDKELRKEREVVVDEINSYRDTPSESVYDDFEDFIFKGTSLGHNILGRATTVRKLRSEDCRNFISRNYTIERSVVYYSGPEDALTISRMVEEYFRTMPRSSEPVTDRSITLAKRRHKKVKIAGLHQSHIILGIPVEGHASTRKICTSLFSNFIGGPGMNSRLNVELREKRGLVYSVEASVSRFHSTGLLSIYFGCDHNDTDLCIDLCRKTLHDIARAPEAELAAVTEATKRQYAGQLTIAGENRENSILAAARATLFCGEVLPNHRIRRMIDAVSVDDIRHYATQFDDYYSLIYM